MSFIIVSIFIIGYVFIASEYFIKINKTATALLTGVLCWTVYILFQTDANAISEGLIEHLGDISGILFFLIGAMTIVELIDSHDGFEVITIQITTTNKRKLLWIISFLAFFLSAVLDNLTTTIVLVTLLRKLVPDKKDRLLFISMVVIAANSGGAWSPIGDVTTTMLWIGNQVTTVNIISRLFVPSLFSLLIPLIIVTFTIKGNVASQFIALNDEEKEIKRRAINKREKMIVFFSGIGVLLLVPVFKTVTHLPPFMGMLFGLGLLWLITELMHKGKEAGERHQLSVTKALQRMDMPSVLFFLGILLAISSLQSTGQLEKLAAIMNQKIGNTNIIAAILGLFSAVVDNVPIVAASIGMYPLSQFPTDHSFWEILAYCAGTGGSVLIIGSAAGVAAMGLEKVEFFWYLRRISGLALIGYFAGIGIYLAEEIMLHF
jgi:Na+/H+ antiporter NhaD/arsenite permease-like protein